MSDTIGALLLIAARKLSAHSSSPRLDAEVLLSHTTGLERATLLAHGEAQVEMANAVRFESLIGRRILGEPVAYLTGIKEFYGLELCVTHDVLMPRPETESVVDACLEYLAEGVTSQMADIGTGSGAIVVAVCKQRPSMTAFATDISRPALKVAEENASRHGLTDRITFLEGDLLQPMPHPVGLIAANLPYVSPGEAEPDVATWEPNVAVFGGGADGSELIRRFLHDAPRYLVRGGRIVMETAHSQGALVAELAAHAFPAADIVVRKDLASYDRIVVIQT